MYVTHLECGACGRQHEARRLQNLCTECGKPLLVRYDLERAARSLTKESLRTRATDLWRYREVLPVERDENIVSLGEGWEVAGRPGSEAHDEIFWSEKRGWYRETNRAGGLEGGMTNGEPLVVQAATKPISTLTQPLRSVDTETREPAEAMRERTDSTVVPAAAVVGEAMVALVLAGAYREKFGGDHIDDVLSALAAYEERIGWRR